MKKVLNFIRKPIVLAFVIPLVILGSYTLAKYVIEEFHSYYTNSKHFYFSSNLLTKNNALYEINNWMGVGNFDISFDLLSQANDYVFSDYDIPFTASVTCPSDVRCEIDKSSGTIYSATHATTITVSVTPLRQFTENQMLDVHVEAQSVSPYVEHLDATFRYVVGKQGVTYEIEDEANRPYMLLKITNAINYCTVMEAFDTYQVGDTIESSDYIALSNTNKKKCIGQNITLDFDPSQILLDTTSDLVDQSTYSTTLIGGVNYINHMAFPIGPLSTISVKYYKANTSLNYTYPIVNNQSIVTVTITDPVVSGP